MILLCVLGILGVMMVLAFLVWFTFRLWMRAGEKTYNAIQATLLYFATIGVGFGTIASIVAIRALVMALFGIRE